MLIGTKFFDIKIYKKKSCLQFAVYHDFLNTLGRCISYETLLNVF